MGIVTEIKHQTKIIRQSLVFKKSNVLIKDKSSIQNLPTDCLERIFLHITTGASCDSSTVTAINKSLFSCVQVNRLWSTLTIPLLWRRPFSIVPSDKQNAILINTLIIFLSDYDKTTLIDKQLKLESRSVHDRELQFNYPQFIKLFDYDNFIKSVHRWVVRYPNDCTEFKISHLLTKLLGNVLFKENMLNGFRAFNFFRTKVYDNFNFISLYELSPRRIFGFLNNLTQLEYRNPHKVHNHNLNEFLDFFRVITIHCSDLKNISLDVNKVDKNDFMEIDQSISKLLSSQKRLKSLSINYSSKIVYNSIYRHANSLNYLHLKGISDVSFLLKIITSCKVLHTLELEQSWKKDEDGFDFDLISTTKIPLPHTLQIKHLYFNCNDERSEILLLFLLELTNSNLTTLSTKLITPNVIQIISTYCRSISTLNVANVPQQVRFNSLLNTISILPLRQLYLEVSYLYFQEQLSAEIYNFASSLPHTLKNLYLKCHITPEYLYILLNRTEARIKSLWLYNVSDGYGDYLKILYKYSLERNNCLKEARFGWNRSNSQRRNRRLSSVNSVDEEFHKNMAKQLKGAVQSVYKTSKGKKKVSFSNEGPFIINEVKDCITSYHEHIFERRLSDYKNH